MRVGQGRLALPTDAVFVFFRSINEQPSAAGAITVYHTRRSDCNVPLGNGPDHRKLSSSQALRLVPVTLLNGFPAIATAFATNHPGRTLRGIPFPASADHSVEMLDPMSNRAHKAHPLTTGLGRDRRTITPLRNVRTYINGEPCALKFRTRHEH